jgi:hypothetical protein
VRDAAELYETPACATRALISTGELDRFAQGMIWEPAAGRGAISRELISAGYPVIASDIISYEGADPGIETPVDFLKERNAPAGAAVTVINPPFKCADAFVRHGLGLGLSIIALLRWQSAEGERRSDLIERHLRRVWLGIERLPMMHCEGWEGKRTKRGGAPFGWFVFEPSAQNSPFQVTRIAWRESALNELAIVAPTTTTAMTTRAGQGVPHGNPKLRSRTS